MKKLLITMVTCLVITGAFAQEKEEKKEKKAGLAINMIQNSVAGFSPVILGNIGINDKTSLTFYSIFWNNPTFGTQESGGDLFLETGIGLGFKLANNNLFVNPSLGFGHGNFLSGAPGTRIADGIIPNIFVLYHKGIFEFDGYFAYYGAMRKSDAVGRNFILNWLAPGVKVSKHFSVGAYYEQFKLASTTDDSAKGNIYQWLGGYWKVNFSKGVALKMALGKNMDSIANASDEFYKISLFFPL